MLKTKNYTTKKRLFDEKTTIKQTLFSNFILQARKAIERTAGQQPGEHTQNGIPDLQAFGTGGSDGIDEKCKPHNIGAELERGIGQEDGKQKQCIHDFHSVFRKQALFTLGQHEDTPFRFRADARRQT